MIHHIKEALLDVAVLLMAFTLSAGACTQKAVACGDGRAVAAQHAP
jgi:hypothetical protein